MNFTWEVVPGVNVEVNSDSINTMSFEQQNELLKHLYTKHVDSRGVGFNLNANKCGGQCACKSNKNDIKELKTNLQLNKDEIEKYINNVAKPKIDEIVEYVTTLSKFTKGLTSYVKSGVKRPDDKRLQFPEILEGKKTIDLNKGCTTTTYYDCED